MLIKEFMDREHFSRSAGAADWKDAVKQGCNILVDDGTVTPEYAQDIIDNTEEYGPYYIVTPNIAAPHSQLNYDHVNKNGMSLLLFDEPVLFGDQPVKVLVTIASTDPREHIKSMERLSEMLVNQEVTDKLAEAKTNEQVLALDTLL